MNDKNQTKNISINEENDEENAGKNDEKKNNASRQSKNPSINNVTYVFTHSTLLDALKEWEKEQIEHYPHQRERIQTTVVAMQHFLRSKQVRNHKMIMSGDPHDFEIAMPRSLELENSPEQEDKPEQTDNE